MQYRNQSAATFSWFLGAGRLWFHLLYLFLASFGRKREHSTFLSVSSFLPRNSDSAAVNIIHAKVDVTNTPLFICYSFFKLVTHTTCSSTGRNNYPRWITREFKTRPCISKNYSNPPSLDIPDEVAMNDEENLWCLGYINRWEALSSHLAVAVSRSGRRISISRLSACVEQNIPPLGTGVRLSFSLFLSWVMPSWREETCGEEDSLRAT